jgi:hypothetical protein
MIQASPKWWAHALFRPYLRNLCKRRFHGLYLLGDVPEVPPQMPLVLAPNHSTWWDGFFSYLLNEHLWQREHYVMMLEHRLREFWFFRNLGAFSVNQQSPKSVAETLSYAASLLNADQNQEQNQAQHQAQHQAHNTSALPNKQPLLVMFPQGELRAWGVRPLGYNRGLEWILRKTTQPVALLPLGILCEFLGEEHPFAFLQCGALHIIQPNGVQPDDVQIDDVQLDDTAEQFQGINALEQEQERLLESMKHRVIAGERGIQVL